MLQCCRWLHRTYTRQVDIDVGVACGAGRLLDGNNISRHYALALGFEICVLLWFGIIRLSPWKRNIHTSITTRCILWLVVTS